MNKKLKEILTSVVVAGRDFIKAGNEIFDGEFGDAIRKQASDATDAMVEAGFADPKNKDSIVDELVYNKVAAYDGLKKFSERAAAIPIGVPSEKAAETAERSSEQVWEDGWQF
jgi:hypothetical protein